MTGLDLARESEPVLEGPRGAAELAFSTYGRNRTKRRGGNGTS